MVWSHQTGLNYLRHGMPVTEAKVRAALVAAVEHVEEQAQLGFSWKPPTLHLRVRGEVVAGRNDRPVPRDLDRDGAVQGAYLDDRSASRTMMQ